MRDLYHDHGMTDDSTVSVVFDWRKYPDARPSSMLLNVFNSPSQPLSVQLQGYEGGLIFLKEDQYGMVAFNSDTENILYRGTTMENLELYTPPIQLARQISTSTFHSLSLSVPKALGTEMQQVVLPPESLWTAVDTAVILSTGEQVVKLLMENATMDYTFIVEKVENLSAVKTIAATISGMSASWIPFLHRPSSDLCIIPFQLQIADNGNLYGTVRTFGHCPGWDTAHVMTIYAQMSDGRQVYFSYDITDSMHDELHVPDNEGHVNLPITISGLPLPAPQNISDDFLPAVEEWEEIEVPVEL